MRHCRCCRSAAQAEDGKKETEKEKDKDVLDSDLEDDEGAEDDVQNMVLAQYDKVLLLRIMCHPLNKQGNTYDAMCSVLLLSKCGCYGLDEGGGGGAGNCATAASGWSSACPEMNVACRLLETKTSGSAR